VNTVVTHHRRLAASGIVRAAVWVPAGTTARPRGSPCETSHCRHCHRRPRPPLHPAAPAPPPSVPPLPPSERGTWPSARRVMVGAAASPSSPSFWTLKRRRWWSTTSSCCPRLPVLWAAAAAQSRHRQTSAFWLCGAPVCSGPAGTVAGWWQLVQHEQLSRRC
jgi:hypothetical protein